MYEEARVHLDSRFRSSSEYYSIERLLFQKVLERCFTIA